MLRKFMPNNGKSMANEKGNKSSGNCIKNLDFINMKKLSKAIAIELSRKLSLNWSIKSVAIEKCWNLPKWDFPL